MTSRRKKDWVVVAARVRKDVYDKIRELAKAEDHSVADVIRHALVRVIEEKEKAETEE